MKINDSMDFSWRSNVNASIVGLSTGIIASCFTLCRIYITRDKTDLINLIIIVILFEMVGAAISSGVARMIITKQRGKEIKLNKLLLNPFARGAAAGTGGSIFSFLMKVIFPPGQSSH